MGHACLHKVRVKVICVRRIDRNAMEFAWHFFAGCCGVRGVNAVSVSRIVRKLGG